MRIRPVRDTDQAAWLGLFRAYADFYKTTPTAEAEAAVWGWIFDASEPFWCDLAVDAQDRPLGFVQYQLMHRSLGGSKVCYLSDLFTLPEARGKGAGRALIDHVRAVAGGMGCPNLRWLTAEDNATARALYDTYQPRTPFVLYSIPT